MSEETHSAGTAAALAERVDMLASEVNALRESIVTDAEWDAEARRVRQIALDTTLADVRWWLRVLVVVVIVLVVLVIIMVWLLSYTGGL